MSERTNEWAWWCDQNDKQFVANQIHEEVKWQRIDSNTQKENMITFWFATNSVYIISSSSGGGNSLEYLLSRLTLVFAVQVVFSFLLLLYCFVNIQISTWYMYKYKYTHARVVRLLVRSIIGLSVFLSIQLPFTLTCNLTYSHKLTAEQAIATKSHTHSCIYTWHKCLTINTYSKKHMSEKKSHFWLLIVDRTRRCYCCCSFFTP